MLQSIWIFILAWYNLPFTLLLAICLLLGFLQWTGLGGDQDTETGGDMDGDAGLDHDLDGDVDPDAEGYADHDVDLHAGSADMPGFSILAYLGLGRAPLLIILLLLLGSVGLLGWLFNSLVTRLLGFYPGLIFGMVLVASLLLGSLISSRIARAIGSALPPVSTTATLAQNLVGRRGTVISPFVDRRYGMVHLRDAAGTLISVFATTWEEPPIRRGEQVVFVQYDAVKRLYEVVRANL
jgi:membrane protein implicated in regulation of membrane protease activity